MFACRKVALCDGLLPSDALLVLRRIGVDSTGVGSVDKCETLIGSVAYAPRIDPSEGARDAAERVTNGTPDAHFGVNRRPSA